MTHAEIEHSPTYPGMLVGGGAASVVGGVTLPIILTVGFTSDHIVPSGFVGLAVAAAVVGAILLAARSVKQDLAQHRADHQTGTLAVEDVHTIKSEMVTSRRHLADVAGVVSQICMHIPADSQGVVRRDAAWLADMAESLEIGREIERRRPPE